jgi:hypothetical protein
MDTKTNYLLRVYLCAYTLLLCADAPLAAAGPAIQRQSLLGQDGSLQEKYQAIRSEIGMHEATKGLDVGFIVATEQLRKGFPDSSWLTTYSAFENAVIENESTRFFSPKVHAFFMDVLPLVSDKKKRSSSKKWMIGGAAATAALVAGALLLKRKKSKRDQYFQSPPKDLPNKKLCKVKRSSGSSGDYVSSVSTPTPVSSLSSPASLSPRRLTFSPSDTLQGAEMTPNEVFRPRSKSWSGESKTPFMYESTNDPFIKLLTDINQAHQMGDATRCEHLIEALKTFLRKDLDLSDLQNTPRTGMSQATPGGTCTPALLSMGTPTARSRFRPGK